MASAHSTFEDRFWSKVKIGGPNDCWEWIGSRKAAGYGQIKIPRTRRNKAAHIASYEMANGPIEDDLCVCHACDNPPCVNPAHLWAGTHQDNVDDKMAKGRDRYGLQAGIANPRSKLSEGDVIDIRAMISSGMNNCQIARVYDVTHQMISRIRLGQNWKHLPA